MKKEMFNFNKQWIWLGVIVFFMLVLVLPKFFIDNSSNIQLNILSDSRNDIGELGSMGVGDFPSNPAGGIPGVSGPTYSGPTPAREIPNIPSTPSPTSNSPPPVVVIKDKTKCSLSCSAETKLIQIDNTHYKLTMKKGERYSGGLGLGNLDENSIVVYDIGKMKAKGIVGSFVFANRSGNRIIVEPKSLQNLLFEVIVNPNLNVPSGTSLGTITIPCDRRRVDIKSQPQTVIKKDSIDLKIEVVMVDCGALDISWKAPEKKSGAECQRYYIAVSGNEPYDEIDKAGNKLKFIWHDCGNCMMCNPNSRIGIGTSSVPSADDISNLNKILPIINPNDFSKIIQFLNPRYLRTIKQGYHCDYGYSGENCILGNGGLGICDVSSSGKIRCLSGKCTIPTKDPSNECPQTKGGKICGYRIPAKNDIPDLLPNRLYRGEIYFVCENNNCIQNFRNTMTSPIAGFIDKNYLEECKKGCSYMISSKINSYNGYCK